MSDLLPLVAEVLRDRATLNAQAELRDLQEQLRTSRSVEIISVTPADDGDDDERGDFVVYAAGQFVVNE